jgi:predicted metal-binding membrane protein
VTGLTLTGRRTGATAAALVGLAAAAWVVALHRMDGMDMGYATELGSLPSFAVAWTSMMAAMMLTVAAGLYELTPLKRRCRERCREETASGLALGVHCVGASVGLMAMFVALGVMNVAWMIVVAGVVLAQKLLPPRAAIDVPLALAIVGLGLTIGL